jgi:uncharacterized membrane protein
MSTKEHNQQKFTQIFLPLILAVFAAGAAAYTIFSGIAGNALDHRVFGDISAILVILPVLILLVFKFIFLVLLIFLTKKIQAELAAKFPKVSSFVEKIARIFIRTTGYAVKPVIVGESVLAALTPRSKRKEE